MQPYLWALPAVNIRASRKPSKKPSARTQRTSYLEAAVQRQDPSDYSQLRSDLRHALTDGALAPYSLTFAFEVLELLLYPGEVSHCPLLSQKTSIPQSLYSSLASLCI